LDFINENKNENKNNINKKKANTHQRHAFRCPELEISNFFLGVGVGGMLPDPLGESCRKAPSVVTAAYYTFSGRL